jgi:N-dimethylarginine dimethylaminohydrolase
MVTFMGLFFFTSSEPETPLGKRTVYVTSPYNFTVEALGSNGTHNNQFETQCAAFYQDYKTVFNALVEQCHGNLINSLETIAEVRVLPAKGNPDEVFNQDIGWIYALGFINNHGKLVPAPGSEIFIQAKMAKPSRRDEPEAFWNALQETYSAQRRILMNHPIEGGDTTLATTPQKGTRIIASVGQRNSREGVRDFAKATGLQPFIYNLNEASGAFHIDVATRILADGTIIVCPEAFQGGQDGDEFKRFVREQTEDPVNTDDEIKAYLEEKAILVSLQDMHAYGINLLELYDEKGNRHLFVPAETQDQRNELIQNLTENGATEGDLKLLPPLLSHEFLTALENTGCTIHKINMLPFIMAGGGVHCCTKTAYMLYDNTPCALPTNSSGLVAATWGNPDNDNRSPDIRLTDETGSLTIQFAPGYDQSAIPDTLKRFLETVTGKPLTSNGAIPNSPQNNPFNDVLTGTRRLTLPPLYTGAPTIQIHVKDERWQSILSDLYTILGNESTPLPHWTMHKEYLKAAYAIQQHCGM